MIVEEEDYDFNAYRNEPFVRRDDESPKITRKNKKKRPRHLNLVNDELEPDNEDNNRFAHLKDNTFQSRIRS